MRLLLRSGYELVMHREGRWTNDLYLCYESMARHHPDTAELARETLELALNPVSDGDRTTALVQRYTPWIYSEILRRLNVESNARY